MKCNICFIQLCFNIKRCFLLNICYEFNVDICFQAAKDSLEFSQHTEFADFDNVDLFPLSPGMVIDSPTAASPNGCWAA